jgi:hypothetical protein
MDAGEKVRPRDGQTVRMGDKDGMNTWPNQSDKPPAYSHVNGRRSVAHRARDAGQPLIALIGARRFITASRLPANEKRIASTD